MQAQFTNPSVAVLPSREGAADPGPDRENRFGHLLYQAAIVVAILVFMLSFWSC